jgi:uncharacterized protein HemX
MITSFLTSLKVIPYVLIVILIGVTIYFYKSNQSLHANYAVLETQLNAQQLTIREYQRQQAESLQAIKTKDEIIQQLETQVSQMDSTLDELYANDNEARTWAEQPFNQAIISRVVNTPIVLE